MSADNLSPADLAAIDAIAAANLVTNRALQELAQAMLDGPQSEKPRPKRSYRLTNVTRGADGELAADVEYADGRIRRFRVSRDEAGDLVGELEHGAAPDDESAEGSSRSLVSSLVRAVCRDDRRHHDVRRPLVTVA
jgi:hypothetical protein